MLVRRSALFAALALCLSSGAATACDRPQRPWCSLGEDRFKEEGDQAACKRAMVSYRALMKGYQACMQEESDDAVKEFNKAVISFAKRAGSTE